MTLADVEKAVKEAMVTAGCIYDADGPTKAIMQSVRAYGEEMYGAGSEMRAKCMRLYLGIATEEDTK